MKVIIMPRNGASNPLFSLSSGQLFLWLTVLLVVALLGGAALQRNFARVVALGEHADEFVLMHDRESADVFLPRHDLRECDHQGRRRHADHRLCRPAGRQGAVSRRRADPPRAGLGRALYRVHAALCPQRLLRHQPQPLRTRAGPHPGRRGGAHPRRWWHFRCADGRRHGGRGGLAARPAAEQRQGRRPAPAPAGATRSSMPARAATSMPAPTCGAAAW